MDSGANIVNVEHVRECGEFVTGIMQRSVQISRKRVGEFFEVMQTKNSRINPASAIFGSKTWSSTSQVDVTPVKSYGILWWEDSPPPLDLLLHSVAFLGGGEIRDPDQLAKIKNGRWGSQKRVPGPGNVF